MRKIKAIVASAMALTLAVPTTAYFSAGASKAKADDAVPAAVTTITMEKGFRGEQETNGLNIVKSEDVLIFKEKTNPDGSYIYEGKAQVYDVTDVPVIESYVYKYGVKGNQPSTAYDENLGSVLVFDDTVEVSEFSKKAEDEYTDVAVGTLLQKATIAHSQVQIKNPLAGKDLTNGATVSYWAKVPTGTAVDTPLVVFSAKDDDNRKASVSGPNADDAKKAAEKAADDSLSVQISAGNAFHYVCSADSVSVAYEGEGSILANSGKWAYVTVSMTDSKIVTYVNGVEVSNKDVAATGLMAKLSDDNTGVFFGGNYSAAAATVGQNFPSVRNTCMDNIAFYTSALTAEEAAKLYDVAVNEANAVDEVLVLEKFDFENGMTGTNGTTISNLATNKENPEVTVDAQRGNVLKIGAGTQSKSAGAVLSANPFAGKDLDGASVSYWVRQPMNTKLKAVVPSVALSFIDAPKKIVHGKLADNYVDELSSSVLFTQTDMEAYFHEGYTGQAYQSVKNDFKTSLRKNTHIDGKTDANGKIEDALYDEDAVAKQALYEEQLSSMTEWTYVTAVFTNAGIKMYANGKELPNNLAEPDDRPQFFGPRFFDGYYMMQYDGYAPFYRATDNQLARTMMNFLTGADTSAYVGFVYKFGSDQTYNRTYESYFDDITYYANALTSEQVATLYDEAVNGPQPSIPPVVPTPEPGSSATPSDPAVSGPSVTNGPASGSAVTGEAVNTDDESVVAPKNAYTGKTGDTANVVVPVVAITAAAAALAVVSKKRKETEE